MSIGAEDGSDSIIPNSRANMAAVAALLRDPVWEVHLVVEGHVGTSAPPEIAQAFSEQRANIVAEYLEEQHGICPGRIVTRGWGYDAANRARASDHPNAAAAKAGYGWAEMFFVYGKGEDASYLPKLGEDAAFFPERPDYYNTALASPPPPAPRTQRGGASAHPIFYMHPGAAVGEDVALHLFEPRYKLPTPLHPLHPLHPLYTPLRYPCTISTPP